MLARILTPEVFGLLALALIAITYLETVGDLGAGAALIYWPEGRNDAAQTAFALNLATGFFWFLTMFLCAPWIADFFREPSAIPVLRAMALTIPLKALGHTHDTLLQRKLRFRERMVPELAMGITKAIVAVGLALAGWGVWSLVVGHIAGQALWTLILWRVEPWRPTRRVTGKLFAPMLRYSRGLVLVNILGAVVHHFDLLVVGRMLGTVALGLYQVAGKVPEMTITMLIWVAGRVLFPVFARINAAGEDLSDAYLMSLRYIALIALPASVGLIVLAEPIVLIGFGLRWVPASAILQGLAAYAGIRALGNQAGIVMKGTGRSGLLAGLAVIKAALFIPALLVGGQFSAVVVAWTMAGVTAITMVLDLAVACRIVGVSISATVSAMAPAAGASAIMAAVIVLLTRWAMTPESMFGLAAVVAIGVSTYAAAVRLLFPEVWDRGARGLARGTPAFHEARS